MTRKSTGKPTGYPTLKPTRHPTSKPTQNPVYQTEKFTPPTRKPTPNPTRRPSSEPMRNADGDSASCSAHLQCADLVGDCCPTDEGKRLGCCSTDTPIISKATYHEAEGSCSAYPKCSELGLEGDCCPTDDRNKLSCCFDEDPSVAVRRSQQRLFPWNHLALLSISLLLFVILVSVKAYDASKALINIDNGDGECYIDAAPSNVGSPSTIS